MRDLRAIYFLAGILATLGAAEAVDISRALASSQPAHPTPTPAPTPAPSLWDRALLALSDTADRYASDEAVADYVMASVRKQERVNRLLAKRGSRFRISEIHVSVGVTPSLEVSIAEFPEDDPPAPETPGDDPSTMERAPLSESSETPQRP